MNSRAIAALAVVCWLSAPACARRTAPPDHRTFATPDEAVHALIDTVKAGNVEQLLAIFGPDSRDLIDSAEPATGRQNREVFTVAAAEGWYLVDNGPKGRTLVIGNEEWPFPIPLVNADGGWRFDTAAGKEEVLVRRIGRNELAVMRICQTYVAAQRRYAADGHDGKRPGLFAASFRSDPGKQNGLYWASARHEKISPLGDLVAEAAQEGRPLATGSQQPQTPFHGYYFKILTAQGADVSGGAKSYLVNDELNGGFALVAWPAEYNASGIMTFIVNHDGILHEKDLGDSTDREARAMTLYNPDASWREVSTNIR